MPHLNPPFEPQFVFPAQIESVFLRRQGLHGPQEKLNALVRLQSSEITQSQRPSLPGSVPRRRRYGGIGVEDDVSDRGLGETSQFEVAFQDEAAVPDDGMDPARHSLPDHTVKPAIPARGEAVSVVLKHGGAGTEEVIIPQSVDKGETEVFGYGPNSNRESTEIVRVNHMRRFSPHDPFDGTGHPGVVGVDRVPERYKGLLETISLAEGSIEVFNPNVIDLDAIK